MGLPMDEDNLEKISLEIIKTVNIWIGGSNELYGIKGKALRNIIESIITRDYSLQEKEDTQK